MCAQVPRANQGHDESRRKKGNTSKATEQNYDRQIFQAYSLILFLTLHLVVKLGCTSTEGIGESFFTFFSSLA